MAGHSKFKNIQHRKGAQDKKRAKIFTRLVREIITAAKAGQPDPELNPRLRGAIATAKAMNLPKDRIEKAISQACSNNDGDNYSEIRYEGFSNGGIAVIVEAVTDNKNRTASEVRSSFTKYGGNLGETGSVNFLFDHVGIIQYPIEVSSNDKIMEIAIEVGAQDVESTDEYHNIYTDIKDFSEILLKLNEKLGSPESANIGWRPKEAIEIEDESKFEKLEKLISQLDDIDDVERVYTNTIYQF